MYVCVDMKRVIFIISFIRSADSDAAGVAAVRSRRRRVGNWEKTVFDLIKRGIDHPPPSLALSRASQREAGVVVLAASHDVRVLGVGGVVEAEDERGHKEQDEAEGLVVDAEDEAGAVAVEALVHDSKRGERLRREGGRGCLLYTSPSPRDA